MPVVYVAPGQFLSVILPTALALMVCNMDRICMAVAIVPMAAEFGWAPSTQASVGHAFHVPMGIQLRVHDACSLRPFQQFPAAFA